jgi:hypothetical protein
MSNFACAGAPAAEAAGDTAPTEENEGVEQE